MRWINPLPIPEKLSSREEEVDTLSGYIRKKAELHSELNILEAGCGSKWGLDLQDIRYVLTGVDIDKDCLDFRVNQKHDLDIAIHGDLGTVTLEDAHYDVIYNSYVLEHIECAERVLNNFVRWLNPGGILLLVVPNRDSAKGFLTRITPFWIHVLYKRYFRGYRNAGKPGYGPFKTYFNEVVSRRGIYAYCLHHGLEIKEEYSVGHGRKARLLFDTLSRLILRIVHLASFRRLSFEHADMIYIIQKP